MSVKISLFFNIFFRLYNNFNQCFMKKILNLDGCAGAGRRSRDLKYSRKNIDNIFVYYIVKELMI